MEKFAGLKFCSFNLIFLHFLTQKCLLRKVALIFMENFHGALENCENCESLAQ